MSLHSFKQLAKSVCSVAESAIKQSLSKAGQKLWDKGRQSQINKHVVYCLPFFPLCRPNKWQAEGSEKHLCTFCEYKIAPWMYILLSFFNKNTTTEWRTGHRHSLYGLPSNLGHDCTLSSQILKGQAQEIVNDKRCNREKRVTSLNPAAYMFSWHDYDCGIISHHLQL